MIDPIIRFSYWETGPVICDRISGFIKTEEVGFDNREVILFRDILTLVRHLNIPPKSHFEATIAESNDEWYRTSVFKCRVYDSSVGLVCLENNVGMKWTEKSSGINIPRQTHERNS